MEAERGALTREGLLVDGRYRLIRPIGSGGMGEVWEATHEAIGRKVALKVLHHRYSRDREVVARFHREARTASLIGDPRIVDVLDMGMLEDGSPYLVMELLHGETLHDYLNREGPLTVPRAVRLAIETAHALAAAHEKGIIHRDLKPENVFLVGTRGRPARPDTSRVKLLDFGIAKMRAASTALPVPGLTQTGAAVGTPTYMSPEQASGAADVDGRADIWSLGVLLYRMLSGKTPFVADGYARLLVAILTEPHTPLDQHRRDLPEGLVALVHRLLEKERAARPASMLAVAEALEPYAAFGDPTTSRPRLKSPGGMSVPPRNPPAPASASRPRAQASQPRSAEPRAHESTQEETRARVADTIRTPPANAGASFAATLAARARGKRRFSPDENAILSLDELLADVPPNAMIKGMYLTQILSRHADRTQILGAAGVVAARWLSFSDAPFTDWVRLVHASARLRWPGQSGPTARSLRTVTHEVFDTFVDSLAGRVTFGVLGRDLSRILAAFARFEVNVKPLTIEVSSAEAGRHQLVFGGFGPAVVEGLFLGVVEGAAIYCGARPTFVLETDGGTKTAVEISY